MTGIDPYEIDKIGIHPLITGYPHTAATVTTFYVTAVRHCGSMFRNRLYSIMFI